MKMMSRALVCQVRTKRHLLIKVQKYRELEADHDLDLGLDLRKDPDLQTDPGLQTDPDLLLK